LLGLFIILYIIITLFIGFWVSRRVKNANDFILAGRKLPLFVNTFALFALWFGSETIFGASSEFLQHGFLGVIEDPFGGALCLILYAVFLARPLYRKNMLTLGDLFRDRYGAGIEKIASFFMLITFIGYIAAQLVALGILLNVVFGTPLIAGIVASAVIVGMYTLTGGMWAVSVTDFFQSIMIISGLIWVLLNITDQGSLIPRVISEAPPGQFDLLPELQPGNLVEYFSAFMVLGLGSRPSQDIFQRFNAARSEKYAVWSGYLGAILYLIMAMVPLFIALSIKTIYPESGVTDSQKVIPQIIMEHASLPVQALLFGALISAIFSTCSGAVLAPSSLLAENILKRVIGPAISERKFLWILRISVFAVTAVAVIMATYRQNIYELVAESSILGLVSILVPMLMAIFGKVYSRTGAILSMVLGFVSWYLSKHVFEVDFPPHVIGLFFSILGMAAGILISRLYRKKGIIKL
jgi:Na+/proline symporter